MVSERSKSIDWQQTPFRDLELIGAGGMGSVARGRDVRNGRAVALKLLTDPNPKKQERFLREAQLAARIEHPNVVRIHEVYPLGASGHVLVTELVDGARHLDAAWATLPIEGRVQWLRDAARGVAAAHAVGVTHRDLKPANILVDGSGRVRVGDFGVAFAADLDRLTQSGAMVGTPSFMAPEQFARASTPGPPSDVWALGVMLYQALTDALPFDEPSLARLAAAIQTGFGRPHRATLRGAPGDLVRVLEQSLRLDPADRLPDAGAFADALDRWLADPGGGRFRPTGRLGLVLAAGAVALATAAVLWGRSNNEAALDTAGPASPSASAESESAARTVALDAALEELSGERPEPAIATLKTLSPPVQAAELDGVRTRWVEQAIAALAADRDLKFEHACTRLEQIATLLPPEARGTHEHTIAVTLAHWLIGLDTLSERAYRRVLAGVRAGARIPERRLGMELTDSFFSLTLLSGLTTDEKNGWLVLLIRLDTPVPFFTERQFKPVMRPTEFSEHQPFWKEYLALRDPENENVAWANRLLPLLLSPEGRAALGPIQWTDSMIRAARNQPPQQALALFEEAHERDPTGVAAIHELVVFHAARGDREKTRLLAERCLERLNANGYETFSASRKTYGRRVHRVARCLASVGEWELARELTKKGAPYGGTQRKILLREYPQLAH